MFQFMEIIGRCEFYKPWPEWDNTIHFDEAQILRQGWAMTYPFVFEIDQHKKTGQFSSTRDIPDYDTTLSDCTCQDFQERKLPCKHIYRLAVELDILEIISRPSYDKNRIAELKKAAEIDAEPEQKKRMESAKKAATTPASIDFENKTAEFKGSGKTPYTTSLESCTCRDFFVRKLPCKHIYRLALELDGKEVEQGINKNEYALFALPVESQKMLFDMLVAHINNGMTTFIKERSEFAAPLFRNGYCYENVLTLESLSALPVSDIKKILLMSVPDMEGLPKKTAQRKQITPWLAENFSAISPAIDKSVIVLEFTEQVCELSKEFFSRFRKKFIREQVPTEYWNGEVDEDGDSVMSLDYSDTRTKLVEFFSQEE